MARRRRIRIAASFSLMAAAAAPIAARADDPAWTAPNGRHLPSSPAPSVVAGDLWTPVLSGIAQSGAGDAGFSAAAPQLDREAVAAAVKADLDRLRRAKPPTAGTGASGRVAAVFQRFAAFDMAALSYGSEDFIRAAEDAGPAPAPHQWTPVASLTVLASAWPRD